MGILQGASLKHWNYFLALESDMEVIARYVEPCKANEETYSQELARTLMSSASEIDVILKAVCLQLEPNSKADSIGKYQVVLKQHIPELFKFKLHIPRWGFELTPWKSWTSSKSPLWWTAYNKVKHHRDTEYHLANFKHTINSVGALFIVNLYYQKDLSANGLLLPMQKLFRVDEKYFGGTTFADVEFGINYNL